MYRTFMGIFLFGNENKIQNFTVSEILLLQLQDHCLIIIQDYRIFCDFQRRIVVKKNFFIWGWQFYSLRSFLEVSKNQKSFVPFSVISHQVVPVFHIWDKISIYQSLFVSRILPQCSQLLIIRKDGIRIVHLCSCIDFRIIGGIPFNIKYTVASSFLL